MKKAFPRTMSAMLTVALLSISLVLPGAGLCTDKPEKFFVNLTEYISTQPVAKVFDARKFTGNVERNGTLNLTIQPVPGSADILYAWDESYEDGLDSLHLLFPYTITEKGWTESAFFVLRPGFPDINVVYSDPILVFPYAVYEVGGAWGGAFAERRNFPGAPTFFATTRVVQFTVIGVETVTVPAGIFSDCVKIARFRGNQADRIGWYAKGIGAVKYVYAEENNVANAGFFGSGYNRSFELRSH